MRAESAEPELQLSPGHHPARGEVPAVITGGDHQVPVAVEPDVLWSVGVGLEAAPLPAVYLRRADVDDPVLGIRRRPRRPVEVDGERVGDHRTRGRTVRSAAADGDQECLNHHHGNNFRARTRIRTTPPRRFRDLP